MAVGDFEVAKQLAEELGIEIPEAPHLTDRGNATLMAKLRGEDLRYYFVQLFHRPYHHSIHVLPHQARIIIQSRYQVKTIGSESGVA